MNAVERMYEVVNSVPDDAVKTMHDIGVNVSDFKKSNVFIIEDYASQEFYNNFFKNEEYEKVDLPFEKVVFISHMRDDDTGELFKFYGLIEENIINGRVAHHITIIHDHGNKLMSISSDRDKRIYEDDYEDTCASFAGLVCHFLINYSYAKSKGTLGLLRDAKVKDIQNNSTKSKIINKLYYIGKNKSNLNIKGKSERDIVWTKSWSCCGHWRKLPEESEILGKNRQGERVVEGMTWVKEHTKGEGELINSIRVIK